MMARVRKTAPPAVDVTMLDPAAWPDWVLDPPMRHDPRVNLDAAHAEGQMWRERIRAWCRTARPDLVGQLRGQEHFAALNSAVMRERRRRLHSEQGT